MPFNRREMLEFTSEAIAQAEACGFAGTAAALRETTKELAREYRQKLIAVPPKDVKVENVELGPVLHRNSSES